MFIENETERSSDRTKGRWGLMGNRGILSKFKSTKRGMRRIMETDTS